MTKATYAFENFGHDTTSAYGRSLSISTKTSINICTHIRGWRASKAIAFLDDVALGKQAVPFRRFTDGVGHRKGKMAAGRYPNKASKAIAAIIRSAISNAANKGLDEDLKIVHICAHKAATPFHQGRQRRRAMKRTHIEVVLKEIVHREKPKEDHKEKAKSATKKADSPTPAKKPVEVKPKPVTTEKKAEVEEKKTSSSTAPTPVVNVAKEKSE